MTKIKKREQLKEIKGGVGVYLWLLKNNPKLLDIHLPNTKIIWNLETCKTDAQNYQTKNEWRKASERGYKAAWKNGWLEECFAPTEQGIKPKGYWTFENCKAEALKYKTRREWQRLGGSGYSTAWKNGWLEDCCVHMGISKNEARKVKNLDTGKIYNSATEAIKAVGFQNQSNISHAIKKGTKCGGYRWSYCDEKGNVIK